MLILALLGAAPSYADDWPMLGRDHTRNPVSPEKNPPLFWQIEGVPTRYENRRPIEWTTESKNVRWKAELGVNTFSTPVVADGLVWIGTTHQEPHKRRAGLLKCFRERDGKLLYEYESALHEDAVDAWTGAPWQGISSTPLVEGDRLDPRVVGGHWPQWRGPNRDNVSTETGLLREWPEEGPPLAWRVEGLGEGIASVSIADGQIYTMTYANDLEFLVALDQATGNLRWAAPVGPAVGESRLMRWLSQRSPTLDGDRLYALTGHGMLVCLSTKDGREHWRKNYSEDFGAKRGWWGYCDYPLIDGDRLICTPGGSEASMIALNKHTGDLLWKSAIPPLSLPSGHYAATVVMEVGGIRQYVSFLQGGLIGIAAEDGRLLWRYDKINERQAYDPQNAITPLVKDDLLFCVGARGSILALLKLVSEDDDRIAVREEYTRPCRINHFQDNLVWVGDRVFVYEKKDGVRDWQLSCLNVTSGESVWEHVEPVRRHDRGSPATTYADGHLYFRSDAVMLVDTRSDEYSEKGRFKIPDHQPASGATTPVIAGGHLYLRDDDRLFAHDIRQDAPETARPEPRTVTLHLPEQPSRVTDLDDRRTSSDSLRSVFVPTPRDVVEQMLELADVKQSDRVYDLGSGDGRIVVTASRKYGSHAIGYELDEDLVAISRAAVRKEGVEALVSIEQEDIYNVDLSEADVVALYLLPKQLAKLIPQFGKLPSGSRIVSHYFEIPGIKPEQSKSVASEVDGASHRIHLYKAPLTK